MAKAKLNLNELMIKIINLLYTNSPDQLSFSKVSRLTKVPRSTLYYYFGNSFITLLAEATNFAMKEFTLLEKKNYDQKFSTWVDQEKNRLSLAIDNATKFPWGPVLYVRYRHDSSIIGDTVREVERKFLLLTKKRWSNFQEDEIANQEVLKIGQSIKVGLLLGFAENSITNNCTSISLKEKNKIIKHTCNTIYKIYSS